jgi:hypothetical protein
MHIQLMANPRINLATHTVTAGALLHCVYCPHMCCPHAHMSTCDHVHTHQSCILPQPVQHLTSHSLQAPLPLRLPDMALYQLLDVTLLLQHQPAGSVGAPAHRAAAGELSSVPQKSAASAAGESHLQAEGTPCFWGWGFFVPMQQLGAVVAAARCSCCSSCVQSFCCSQGIVLLICTLKPLFDTGTQEAQRLLGRRACLL